MLDYLVVGLAVGIFGVIAYFYGLMRSKSNRPVKTTKGRTIVVDRTPVDTSKEDKIADKFGDLE